MWYFLIPILAMLGILFFLTLPMIRRKLGVMGIWGGLLLLLSACLVSYLLVMYENRRVFTDWGPCSLCYEWSGMGVLFVLGISVIVGILYLVISTICLRVWDKNDSPTLPSGRYPLVTAILCAIPVVLAGAFVASGALMDSANRTQLKGELESALPGSTIAAYQYLGQIPVKSTIASWFRMSPEYALPGGLVFSPGNRWLAVLSESGVQVLDLESQKVHHIYKPPYTTHSLGAFFSSDGSWLLINFTNRWMLYSTGNWSLAWEQELEYDAQVISFTEDELILISGDGKTVYQFVPASGAFQKVQGPNPTTTVGGLIAAEGNTAVFLKNGIISVKEVAAGTTQQEYTLLIPEYSGGQKWQSAFLPGDRLFLWRPFIASQGIPESYILGLKAHHQDEVALTLPWHEFPTMSVLPGTTLAVFASGHQAVFYELGIQEQTGKLELDTAITSVVFSPDGALLVMGTADGNLLFYGSK